MFEYNGTLPLPVKAGDNIEVVDDIKRGSVICFHRQSENLIYIRTLSPEGIANYPGPKFIVDAGSTPGTLKLDLLQEEANQS
ncbi:hypothetical protein [Trichloromonas sp.]|uniref:hypothetical protein n=1 Tax=Trichloromonas sp. TaxID=3069249 RepID=UPI003D815F0A